MRVSREYSFTVILFSLEGYRYESLGYSLVRLSISREESTLRTYVHVLMRIFTHFCIYVYIIETLFERFGFSTFSLFNLFFYRYYSTRVFIFLYVFTRYSFCFILFNDNFLYLSHVVINKLRLLIRVNYEVATFRSRVFSFFGSICDLEKLALTNHH